MSGLSEQQGVVEQVAWRKRWHNNNWGGNWHHRRHHHHDNDNFGWWGVPLGFGLGLALTAPYYNSYGYGYRSGYGNSHVDYCMRRYRSYDPSTNTFMGYDGYRHECVGPY